MYGYGFKCFRFRLEIWSCGTGINWVKRERNKGKRVEDGEGRGLSLSCFIKDNDCNGVSTLIGKNRDEKGKMKRKNSKWHSHKHLD